MSNYFNHTPQSTDIANQVENLAQEVDQAFLAVEEDIFKDNQENSSIGSSIGSLDNKYVKEYVPNNGWIDNYEQDLFFPDNSQEASLDLMPSTALGDLNAVVISNLTNPSKIYNYSHTGLLLTETDFTFVEKKVIFGRAPVVNETLKITYKGYNTTTPDDDVDWPFELRYNVLQIKQLDNTIVREFTVTGSAGSYTVSGYDFKSMCSTFIQNVINNNLADLSKYVAIYSNNIRLNITSINITNTNVQFETPDVVGSTVKIYVANASIGRLLECLYRLFYAHDHSTNGGNSVNHGSLLGLFENTYDVNDNPIIQYQTSRKSNYDHPQYLNREGFINDEAVYNNAIIGDLLLASTDEANRRNNLNDDSIKIVFGDYSSGHRLFFNHADDCLWLDSISRDGIKLTVPDNKRALSINDHSFVDTTYISPTSNNALKLTVKSDSNAELGIFQLTRKLINAGVATDDDQAKFLAYASEYTLSLIKDTLTIEDGGKISFGSPSIIDIVKEADGLHFTAEIDGTPTGAASVHFDIPVYTDNLNINHLDAKEIHIKDDQKIVFGSSTHELTDSSQYINYNAAANKLTLHTTKGVKFESDGRLTGVNINDTHYIYSASPYGTVSAGNANMFIESTGDVHYIKAGQTLNTGALLSNLNKADVYVGNSIAEGFTLNYLASSIKALTLNNDTFRLFSQTDETGSTVGFIQGTQGISVISGYNLATHTPTYGNLKAFKYESIGTSAASGFYGNVHIPINNTLTVDGSVQFNSNMLFTRPVTFADQITATDITAESITTETLIVTGDANYTDLTADTVEVLTELKFSKLSQTNNLETSKFEGPLELNNNVFMPNSNNSIILGNQDIENTRNTSGLLLTNNEVKLGVNGKVSAAKVIAGKGIPSGNGDETGGFAFSSTTGLPDGDTGMFCESNIEAQSGSDLVFRVDGIEKGRIPKEDVDLDALSIAGKEKVLVTLDLMLAQLTALTSNVLETVYPIGSIYENSIDGRNPSILLNWEDSVWRRYAVGRSIIGAAGNGVGESPDSYLDIPAELNLFAAGTKYGNYKWTLVEANTPPHRHVIAGPVGSGSENLIPEGGGQGTWSWNFNGVGAGQLNSDPNARQFISSNSGNATPFNITHPIIVTHVWERVG